MFNQEANFNKEDKQKTEVPGKKRADKNISILFLGKYDENLHWLEENVVNLMENDINIQINKRELPDVIKYKINGFQCEVWTLVGDVKPTLLLKDLIKNCQIILLCYNLLKPDSLDFINKGWYPIIERSEILDDKQDNLEIILVGIQPQIKDSNLQDEELIYNIEEKKKITDNIFKNKICKYFTEDKNKENISQKLKEFLREKIDEAKEEIEEEEEEKETEEILKIEKEDEIEETKEDEIEEEEEELETEEINKFEEEEEEPETEEEKRIEKQFEEEEKSIRNEKSIEFKDKDSISYKLYAKQKLGEIVSAPKASGDIFISANVDYKNREYKIIRVGEKSFLKSPIETISFSEDSNFRICNSAFENSDLQKLFILGSLIKFDDLWYYGARKLTEIEIDQNNRRFSFEDGFLIRKQGKKRAIIFAPRNFEGNFSVPKTITGISGFSQVDGLLSIKSSSSKLQTIGPYAFYQCENLKSVNIQNSNLLSLGKFSFSETPKLSEVTISCKGIQIHDNCFENCKSLTSLNIQKTSGIYIYPESFKGCTSLKKLSFTDSDYIKIGRECIRGSTQLKTISFNNVKKVILNPQAFKSSEGLENISIDNAIEINIGQECFANSLNMKYIELLGEKIILGDYFIDNCISLTDFKLQSKNDDVVVIHSNIFKTSQLKTFTLHSPKVKLCTSCFEDLSKLESINIKCKNIEIKEKCFHNCKSLTSFKLQVEQDMSITTDTFCGCLSLESLMIGATTKLTVPNEFMNGFNSLREVCLSGHEINIGDFCFKDCSSLTDFIIIKSGTIRLGKNQFNNCKNLKNVSIESTIEQKPDVPVYRIEFGNNCFLGSSNLEEFHLIGGDVKISNDCFKYCTSLKRMFITKANSVVIEKDQFSNIKSLQSIIIESTTLTRLGNGCFSGLTNLKTAIIRGNVILIDNSCFMNCSSLAKLTFDDSSDITLGKGALRNCASLNQIDLSSTKTLTVDVECFSSTGIKSISFQSEIIKIGKNCFKDCKTIESFTIISAIETELGVSAFEGCDNLQKVILNTTSRLKIQDRCFYGAKNLWSVEMSGNEIITGKSSFYYCISIPSLTLQDSSKVIFGDNSFENCSSIQTVTITATQEFQGGFSCFSNSTSLKTVQITSYKLTISSSCFSNCSSMTSFTIPSSNEASLGNSAFEKCSNMSTVDVTATEKLKASDSCFNKASSLRMVKFDSKQISFGSNCFDKCVSLSQVNCPSANVIQYRQSSFNKSDFKKYLKCRKTTVMKIIKSKEENDDECTIF